MDNWTDVNTVADGGGAIVRYSVYWEENPGALVIQIEAQTGAIIRHLFPLGTVESVSSMTMRDSHRVCINPTFTLDTVIFGFGSAKDALLFHWAIVSVLPRGI